ncbi:MAG: hypothetical protein M3460_13145 [Actinomycetota bacterium]|nr:hypothetical protein [Actinomycetota bacterium]
MGPFVEHLGHGLVQLDAISTAPDLAARQDGSEACCPDSPPGRPHPSGVPITAVQLGSKHRTTDPALAAASLYVLREVLAEHATTDSP